MPSGITIIGLGPGDSQDWTRAADTLFQQADEVYVRTTHHPSVADIPAKIHSFDEMYQSAGDTQRRSSRLPPLWYAWVSVRRE